jgi:signal recognition particle GTPase
VPGLYFSFSLGRDNDFDVVLIDTAGRMQDNEVIHQLVKYESQSLLTMNSH